MLKRGYKLIICVVLVSALLCSFCTSFASAELPTRSAMQRFNAWVAAAITAANITINSTIAPVQSLLDTLSYGIGMPWTPEYTYQGATWDDDILNRSTIKINPGIIEIDGVLYSDIIISSDATEKFRVNAFDLETAWNIASNSEGTFAHGVGLFNGIPIFDTGSTVQSQFYEIPSEGSYSIGDTISTYTYYPGLSQTRYSFTAPYSASGWLTSRLPYNLVFRSIYYTKPYSFQHQFYKNGSTIGGGNALGTFIDESFDFDWVSGTVPAEHLPEGSQLHFLVPSENVNQQLPETNYSIPELTNTYPQYNTPDGYTFEFDPSLNPDFDIDIEASDALGNIISAILAAYLAGLIDTPSTTIEYTVNHDPTPQPGVIDPLPDPEPAPEIPTEGTTIADTDWTKLDEILRWIQSTIDSLRYITESLQTVLDSIYDAIQQAIQTIQQLPQQILEDIETGPSKVFRKALDILKALFMPLLLPIKAMMGLWHYVVEWITSIVSPFTWILGVMSGTSGNMVLPIYAALAGSICIAIYKALGR